MSLETKTTTSNAVIVRPTDFVFSAPAVVASNVSVKTQNAFDLKLKHTCDHRLSTGTYKLENCPRCLGTGYYYDIKFTETGQLFEVSLEDKLTQALEKLALTDKNVYHPEIAMGVQKWAGILGSKDNFTIIQNEIRAALLNLQEVQKTVRNLSPRAKIAVINEIVAELINLTTLDYRVTLTTVSGEQKTITGTILLQNLNI